MVTSAPSTQSASRGRTARVSHNLGFALISVAVVAKSVTEEKKYYDQGHADQMEEKNYN